MCFRSPPEIRLTSLGAMRDRASTNNQGRLLLSSRHRLFLTYNQSSCGQIQDAYIERIYYNMDRPILQYVKLYKCHTVVEPLGSYEANNAVF